MIEYDIIREPLLSEKTYKSVGQNIYTFFVDIRANKKMVKGAVEKIYNTEVDRVNILVRKIEKKPFRMSSRRGYSSIKTSNLKLAFVKLKKDKKINLLDDPFKETDVKKANSNK